MKQFRGTLILLVLVGGFALYAYFGVFKKQQQESEFKEKQSILIPAEKEKVTRIKINKGGLITELVKEKDDWMLVAPIQDLADEDVVSGYIDNLISEKSESEIDDKDLDYKAFGVDLPIHIISVEADGKTTNISVGTHAIGGKLYVKRNEEPSVFVANSSWIGHGERTIKDLRAKSLYRLTGKSVKEITIENNSENNKQKVQLVKDGEKWIQAGTKTELGSAEVDNYVRLIESLKAIDFVSEDKTEKGALAKFGLNSHLVKLTLAFTEGDPWSITLSPVNKTQEAHAVVSNLKPVFKVMGVSATQFVKTASDFRDKTIPFKFQRADVKEIEVKTDLAEVALINKDGKWQMKNENPEKVVDQTLVDSFVNQVHELKAKDFLKGSSLATKKKLALKDQSGKTIIEIGWADPIKNKNEYKVKSSLSSEVVTLEAAVLNSLPIQTMIKDKSAATPEPRPGSVTDTKSHPPGDGHGH